MSSEILPCQAHTLPGYTSHNDLATNAVICKSLLHGITNALGLAFG
jgi:hypothetical protein